MANEDLRVKPRNLFLFTIMVLLWGSNWSIEKIGLNNSTPFAFVFHRLLLSAIFLITFSTFHKPKVSRDRNTFIRMLVYGTISTVSYAASNLGLSAQSSGIGAILTYTQPIMVFIMAAFFLKETFNIFKLIGTLLGFFGVGVLFFQDNGSILSWSSFQLLIGALFWGIGTIFFKLKLRDDDAIFVNLIQSLMTCATMFAMNYLFESAFTDWNWMYLSVVAYAGIGASGIGMTIWLFLLKDEEATSLASSSLIVPMLALIFGWLILGEALSLRSLVGSTMVLIGIYLVSHFSSRRDS